MRAVQGAAARVHNLIAMAQALGAETVALPLDAAPDAWRAIEDAALEPAGWWQAARDPDAAAAHPDWMHAPQHHEWLRRFPGYEGGHPALVAPYIGLGTVSAFGHALARLSDALSRAPMRRVFLADIQGPPMGCGCGNPSCRSWDNAPGDKVAPSAYDRPEVLFPLHFLERARDLRPDVEWTPILCAECERGIAMDGVHDPDGPDGTNLCQGVACIAPCATEYWPRLLAGFRAANRTVGLVLTVDALERDHPVYGASRAWASRAHRHYGADLLPVIEPQDASRFDSWLVVHDYPQDCRPVAPPPGYVPSVPPVRCGCP